MFDEMTIKARVDNAQQMHIIKEMQLQECTKGETVYWQSSALGKFDAFHIMLLDGLLNMRFSCHKLYTKYTEGKLDNSNLYTCSQASATIYSLMDKLQLNPEQVKCTRFEIGISMPMLYDPLLYIKEISRIAESKETYIDSCYEKDRQRTTIRTKTVKKVLKVYDKTYEARDKGRDCIDNILRIETIYKRQSQTIPALLSPSNLKRLQTQFYKDWTAAKFARTIKGDKGTKASQLDKAVGIITEGLTEYRDRQRQLFLNREITKKTWQTIRTFCDSWEAHSLHYKTVIGQYEKDYLETLNQCYSYVIK